MASVIYEKKDHIAYISINRPEAMNAINGEAWQGILRSFESVRDDPEVRVAIVSAAGDKAFSVGADLKDIFPLDEIDPIRRLNVWKPLIAAVKGHCLGLGFFIASACDFRIAGENAAFGIPEVRIGFSPRGGTTQWLPRMVPPAIALEYLMTGDRIEAKEALRLGLVNKIVANGEVMATAEALAQKIAANPPLAVQWIKQAVWRGLQMSLPEGLELEMSFSKASEQTEDHKEAMAAFFEKRQPVYKGK